MKYLLFLSLLFSPFFAIAQTQDFSSLGERAVIEISPAFPSPGENILAKVRSSYYSDLNRSNIIWYVNGAERKRGLGETTFQFQSPNNGSSSQISVVIEDGEFIVEGSLTIRPGNLDLVYEANTYTPPFYKGRSLFTHESIITVAAIADFVEGGVKLPKSQIIYTWKKDGSTIPEASGLGKDSIRLQGRMVQDPFYISVTAESLNSDLVAEKRILIDQVNPKVVLYENNPIYGNMFEKALAGTFNFDRDRVGITAIPYFFSVNNRGSTELTYKWYENGRRIGNETFGSFINYLNPNLAKSGVSNISVEVDHNDKLLQSGKNSFQVNVLGQQQSGTIDTNEKPSAF